MEAFCRSASLLLASYRQRRKRVQRQEEHSLNGGHFGAHCSFKHPGAHRKVSLPEQSGDVREAMRNAFLRHKNVNAAGTQSHTLGEIARCDPGIPQCCFWSGSVRLLSGVCSSAVQLPSGPYLPGEQGPRCFAAEGVLTHYPRMGTAGLQLSPRVYAGELIACETYMPFAFSCVNAFSRR